MNTYVLRCAALVVLLSGASAHAAFISGTFSGVAENSLYVQGVGMFGDFDGAPVNGSFRFQADGSSLNHRGSMEFDVPGIVNYVLPDATLAFRRDSMDRIELDYGVDVSTPYGLLILSAPLGSLPLIGNLNGAFTGIDFAAFDPSVFIAQETFAIFGRRRGPTGEVAVASLLVSKEPPAPVPEPATIALLGVGLIGLAFGGRRRTALASK